MESLKHKFIEKSIEAFILGLEIQNKPTIKYRNRRIQFFHMYCLEIDVKSRVVESTDSNIL